MSKLTEKEKDRARRIGLAPAKRWVPLRCSVCPEKTTTPSRNVANLIGTTCPHCGLGTLRRDSK